MNEPSQSSNEDNVPFFFVFFFYCFERRESINKVTEEMGQRDVNNYCTWGFVWVKINQLELKVESEQIGILHRHSEQIANNSKAAIF